MDIEIYDRREQQLALREKLIVIEESGKSGVQDIDARSVSKEFRERLNYNYELQH